MTINKFQPLIVEQIPLEGVHLIEASAGTGKTFNITRIYLRLLIEKKLTVQQILVMTFTRDATEEIRGRVDSFIRYALNNWDSLVTQDPFFIAIAKTTSTHEAKLSLKRALLFMDEAAIFTIHGFCQSVLSQHAFATDTAFNANVESDLRTVHIQAIADWYRRLALSNIEGSELISEFWATPESFFKQFSSVIGTKDKIHVIDPSEISNQFNNTVSLAIDALQSQKSFLFEQLVYNKKADEKNKRTIEYEALISWLKACSEDLQHCQTTMPDKFIDGKRYGRSAYKAELALIFDPVKKVKKQKLTLLKDIRKARALTYVLNGMLFVNESIDSQKHKLNLLSFDDLIQQLAQKLSSDHTDSLSSVIRSQYPFALVDEFQDTDIAQYQILKALYGKTGKEGLIMIGDPKQAIYGFRGGDIFTYMSARKTADYCWLMDTNWRSTKGMINGYNRLFYGNNLDSESAPVFGYNIDYIPVKPSQQAIESNDIVGSSLNFVYFPPETKRAVSQLFRPVMANWCASEIVKILADKSSDVEAKDIALLVRDSGEAADIKQALQDVGLSSVYLSDRTNLWQSEQTSQLIPLLKGILYVENERLFCAAIASPLLGLAPVEYLNKQADDLKWQTIKLAFIELKQLWQRQGFITMALKLMHDHMMVRGTDAERQLTNVLHLFELLQAKSQQCRQPMELLHWLESQHSSDTPEQETELRLASEENLIRIVTQHGSKGLEYPIVFVPYVTRHKNPLMFGNQQLQVIRYHNEQGEFCVSLSGDSNAKLAMADEAYAETIRLLYVAITRAERRCYLLVTPFDKYHLSPLGKTLKWQADENIVDSLMSLMSEYSADISIETIESVNTQHYIKNENTHKKYATSRFLGKIERDWWLSSFTALSKNLRDNGVSTPDRNDEQSSDVIVNSLSELSIANHDLLRFNLPKGAKAGNLLHDIFEHTEFSNIDWEKSCFWPLKKFGELGQGYNVHDLYLWLDEVIQTPLFRNNSVKPSFNLSKLLPHQYLKEVEFYFPLEDVCTRTLTKLLISHRQKVSKLFDVELVRGDLYLPAYRKLKGMMHGYIDLVFETDGKFYLCDYKSTHLGNNFVDYNVNNLVKDIQAHHYDLQYLIYSIALHRYLEKHIPNYCPEKHFGGVYYFYLRGMTSKPTILGNGVFFYKLPTEDITQLDDLFKNNELLTSERSIDNG